MYFHKQQRSNKDVNHRLPNCLYISKNPRLVKLYFSPIVFVFIGYRCLFFWHTTLSYLSSSSPFLEPKLYTSILYPTFFSLLYTTFQHHNMNNTDIQTAFFLLLLFFTYLQSVFFSPVCLSPCGLLFIWPILYTASSVKCLYLCTPFPPNDVYYPHMLNKIYIYTYNPIGLTRDIFKPQNHFSRLKG